MAISSLTVKTDCDVSGTCLYIGDQYIAHVGDRKQADEIVHKFNNHDLLLNACQSALQNLKEIMDTIIGFDAGDRREKTKIEKQLSKAIKAAQL